MKARDITVSLLLAALGGCVSTPFLCVVPEYDCIYDGDRRDGVCLFDSRYGHFCAFPDRECPSGYRWSRREYAEFSGECIDPTLVVFDSGESRDGGTSN